MWSADGDFRGYRTGTDDIYAGGERDGRCAVDYARGHGRACCGVYGYGHREGRRDAHGSFDGDDCRTDCFDNGIESVRRVEGDNVRGVRFTGVPHCGHAVAVDAVGLDICVMVGRHVGSYELVVDALAVAIDVEAFENDLVGRGAFGGLDDVVEQEGELAVGAVDDSEVEGAFGELELEFRPFVGHIYFEALFEQDEVVDIVGGCRIIYVKDFRYALTCGGVGHERDCLGFSAEARRDQPVVAVDLGAAA